MSEDKNTKAIVKALGQLGNVIGSASSNKVLGEILKELKKINKRLDKPKTM